MPRIVVTEFVSLDNVFEDPGGSESYEYGGWTFEFPGEERYAFKSEEIDETDALLLGRITYEGFAAAWPSREDRKSTRLNSSHSSISYAVFCLKKKKQTLHYTL